MNPLYIGFLAMFIGTLLSYAIREYLEGKLSVEQIGAVSLAQRKYRLRLLLALGVTLLLVLIARMVVGDLGRPLFYTFLASVVLAYLWFYSLAYKSASNVLSVPQRRLLLAAFASGFVGFASLAGSMAAT